MGAECRVDFDLSGVKVETWYQLRHRDGADVVLSCGRGRRLGRNSQWVQIRESQNPGLEGTPRINRFNLSWQKNRGKVQGKAKGSVPRVLCNTLPPQVWG